VIDCSAMVRLLTDRGPTGHAVRDRIAGLTSLVAPGLLDYEIASALLGLLRGRKVTAAVADKAVGDYRRLPVTRHETLVLWDRVRELNHNVGAYDAQYVALAEAIGLPLITSDARIGRGGAARCRIETFA